jgi:hypothetical protein
MSFQPTERTPVTSHDSTPNNGRQAEEVRPDNIRRKEAYRQMALTINGGPTGAGNRVELPNCVLSGIRSMFPDADGQYMGHRGE